jgi:hypothetical protein
MSANPQRSLRFKHVNVKDFNRREREGFAKFADATEKLQACAQPR